MYKNRKYTAAILSILLISITGCSSTPLKIENIMATVSIEPNEYMNTDKTNIQRPVKIKIYYLKDDVKFKNGTFEQLFLQTNSYLSSDIIKEKTYQVIPSKNLTIKELIPIQTNNIAVVAAFMSLENKDWKAIIKKPKKCITCIKKIKKPIRIILDGSKVSISTMRPSKKGT